MAWRGEGEERGAGLVGRGASIAGIVSIASIAKGGLGGWGVSGLSAQYGT